MPKLKSVAELDKLRSERQQADRAALATGTRIYVGLGTCGIAAGAREAMTAIKAELAQRHIEAEVVGVGCIGMCVKEPLVDIQQAGQPRITYANVQPEMIPRLIEEHLVQGRPVKEWTVGRLAVEG